MRTKLETEWRQGIDRKFAIIIGLWVLDKAVMALLLYIL